MAEGASLLSHERDDKLVDVVEDITGPWSHLIDDNGKIDASHASCESENGHFAIVNHDGADVQLFQVLAELSFQNVYLKSQIRGFSCQLERPVDANEQNDVNLQDGGTSEQVNQLHEKIKSLNKEIEDQKETQRAAENALEHLRQAFSVADSNIQELSAQLAEAHRKMEQEIKERDDKYVELDSKFGRLHKRAKQRIQELQKEKDELEAHLRDVNGVAEQALNQHKLTQQELERARQHASEALRSMDAERQHLRTINRRLQDAMDEMHQSLEQKDSALEALQQSFCEKEKVLETVRGLLQSAEEKNQTLTAELSSEHIKQIESLEAQLADALSDRSKAAESISSLQILLAEKDTKIAELDAASTGEAVRLGAALEEVRGELSHLKDSQMKERQHWEAVCQTLRVKLETSENACVRSEIEAAKLRSQLELESSTRNQLLNAKDGEITGLLDEMRHLENEFSAYKVRAHALLQKKDAEVLAAKNSESIKAQEEAIREAEKELAQALIERDKAIQDLQDALVKHEKQIASKDFALKDAEKEIKEIYLKLETTTSQFLREKESWKKNLESVEESWRLKYSSFEAQKNNDAGEDQKKNLEYLKMQYKKLKEEHDTFRDITDRTMGEKDKEIVKLIEENKKLQQELELRSVVDSNNNQKTATVASGKQESHIMNIAAAEQQILLLARQQAQREEELAQSQRHILALQEEIEELECENRLHSQQEAMLKAELRNMERSQKREGVDMTYLKNVILKLLETGEVEALLPVIGTLLQFSPEEIRKCQQAYHASTDGSSLAPAGDSSSTPLSLFSRFSFQL